MITIQNDALVITIKDAAPEERLQWIKRSLLAAMRWEALADNGAKYLQDVENKIVLTQLMEEIIE